MSRLPKQTSRKDFIARLKQLGWTGPRVGRGKHPEFMEKGAQTLQLPNEHRGDIREGLLKNLLEQGGISDDEWLNGGKKPLRR